MQIPARIGGRAVSADEWIEVLSPYDGAPVARVPALGADHVAEAVAAAAATLARGDFPQRRRAEVLERAAELLAERTEEFAVTIAREAGKPIRDARAEAGHGVQTLRLSAVEARRPAGEVAPLDGPLAFTLRQPVGVIAAITPFTFPLALVAHRLGPAIAAGCPVVLKPAEPAPVSAIRLVDLLVEAGLPADWISVVTGTGAAAGEPLAAHPGSALVTFTGSAEEGRRIEELAPHKRVLLDPGATTPLIVEPDADLERVIAAIRQGGTSTLRVLANHEIYDKVLSGVRAAVATLVVGDPLDEATEVGPLISVAAATWVESRLAAARKAGADVTGGARRGALLTPAVVADPSGDLDIYRHEVSGPVVTVAPYRALDEAIALANDGDPGRQAVIFTSDVGAALRAARELRFGGVLINQAPGYREEPASAVNEMTDLRFVMVSA